eukprot:s3884_g1.t1
MKRGDKGGYGGYGGGGGGGASYGVGGETEEMEVDDRDIGRIVGRGGCNIRDLQEGTKCKIITPNKRGDNDDPSLRKVLIQGSKEQIAKCKEAINGKIEEEMKVRIELDARSARIWGNDNDHDKALNAKERIEEEMEDITTVDTCTVSVPAHLVNQVINDSALRQLQDSLLLRLGAAAATAAALAAAVDQTGLTANVCKNDQGTGIRLTGLAGAISEAKQLIERRGAGEGAEFLALMPGLFSKMPPKAYSDFQRDVSFLMQNTGAQVTLSEGSNRADFRGGPDEVRRAKAELQKILHFYFPQDHCLRWQGDVCLLKRTPEVVPEGLKINVDPKYTDKVIKLLAIVNPRHRKELMRLQSAGAVIALDRGAATMWMCGNPRSVEQVRNRVRNSLQRWDREHAVIQLPSRESAWAIIGKGGSTIRELQTSTQARIDVDPDNQRVTISGKEDI